MPGTSLGTVSPGHLVVAPRHGATRDAAQQGHGVLDTHVPTADRPGYEDETIDIQIRHEGGDTAGGDGIRVCCLRRTNTPPW